MIHCISALMILVLAARGAYLSYHGEPLQGISVILIAILSVLMAILGELLRKR
jgi:ABC-type Mn2+/Zn2+ transport system permease subunit